MVALLGATERLPNELPWRELVAALTKQDSFESSTDGVPGSIVLCSYVFYYLQLPVPRHLP